MNRQHNWVIMVGVITVLSWLPLCVCAEAKIQNLTVAMASRDQPNVLYFEIPASAHDGTIYAYFDDAIEILDVWDDVGRLRRYKESVGHRKLDSAHFVGKVTFRYERYWNRWFVAGTTFDAKGEELESTMYFVASNTKRILIKYRYRVPGGDVDVDRYMLWLEWNQGLGGFPDYETMALDMIKDEPGEDEVILEGEFPRTIDGIGELQESISKERELLRAEKSK